MVLRWRVEGHEEERLVLDDRPAQRAAELVEAIAGARAGSGLRMLLAQLFAFSLLWRKNSKAEPWNSLVPDLVTTLMTAPPARPYSAE